MKSLILFILLSGGTLLMQAQKFWLIAPSFPLGLKTSIVSVTDSLIYIGTTSGILRTYDQCHTFDTLLAGTYIYSLYVSNAGHLFAGGNGVIYRSADSGDTWDTRVLNAAFPVRSFVETSAGDLFASTGIYMDPQGFEGAGVYYSGDDGVTWIQKNTGLASTLCIDALAIDRQDHLYVAVADNDQTGVAGLFYSPNLGSSWLKVQVTIDGRGAIPDQIRIYSTTSISISPADTVCISVQGVAINVGVELNLRKNIFDMPSASEWSVVNVAHNVSWWLDRLLYPIHFAQNGDWYSSSAGSVQLGKTWLSKDKGRTWSAHDAGLGLDVHGRRNVQYFTELSSGRIYMVQRLAELIHYTDTSQLITSIMPNRPNTLPITLYPNPVGRGTMLYMDMDDICLPCEVSITDIQGRRLWAGSVFGSGLRLPEDISAGVHTVQIIDGVRRAVWQIVVD